MRGCNGAYLMEDIMLIPACGINTAAKHALLCKINKKKKTSYIIKQRGITIIIFPGRNYFCFVLKISLKLIKFLEK